jgi:Redoxin
MRRVQSITITLAILLITVPLFAGPSLNKPAPDFTLIDSKGKEHTLSEYKGKLVVLEWVNFGCPFVGKHYNSGHMQKLQGLYTSKDVVWLSICSSAEGKQGYIGSAEEINEKLAAVGQKSTAYLLDSDGQVGRMYDAKTTPHMFVINKEGILLYDGAIDDTPSTRLADIETADNYVMDVLDNLLAGKQVEAKRTSPYGCSVKYK